MKPFGELQFIKNAIVLNDEQIAWLRKYFPIWENSRIMEHTGMKFSTLHRFARKLKLHKSEAGLKAIKKRQAKQVRKTCRANGYYARLKGRPIPEACQIANAKVWEEIREGKRKHPLHILRDKNPKKYNALMRRKSEARKELLRKEAMRLEYGLPRRTKIAQIVSRPYTVKQINRRHCAILRGYLLSTDKSEEGGERYIIYYDNETTRSARFEQNCIKEGFKIQEDR